MSNTEKQVDHNSDSPQGSIKSPQQLLLAVILAFLVPIAIIVMLVNLVSAGMKTGAGSNALTEEAIATRIQPVASFALATAEGDGNQTLKTGKEVYEATCATCHGTGLAGAPTFGDNAAWGPLIEEGFDAMLKIAINGVGAMPAKGGNPALDDIEVARAVVYMANEAGASFDEPAAPEGADDAATEEAPAADEAAAAAAAAAAPAEETPAAEAPTEEAAPAQEAEAPAETTAAIDPAAKKLYDTVCFACHTTGVAGAPKLGDKDGWAPYIASGMDTMVQKAIHGVGAMPPRGGSQASDDEIRAAVEYMVQESQ
ncbi:c-type cytochrome [Paenalcaligenes niemegkensis]|uniref:c-type cytochrome n=1 Tax=Paenalcaligenes niemegkensis TaxID=2895469 RepID=UPI001EE8D1A7|nr:c-type cytochrome [Paenalcaligenes niemegkensis]MCQ9617518.1 c-type cytochrome [Paenalcaligenes niemegkensis]